MRTRKVFLSSCVLAAMSATLVITPSPPSLAAPAAAGVQVYVGYADVIRPGHPSALFPRPWAGASGVTFQGCQPLASCIYDTAAVRVVNSTGATVSIDAVKVHLDNCTYSGWPAVTLAPGDEYIVSQAAGASWSGCAAAVFYPNSLDMSEIGPLGSPYIGICTPDGVIPTVEVVVNGKSHTSVDTTQVLNTDGYDLGLCPNGTDESHPWTKITSDYVALGDSFSSGEGVSPYGGPAGVRPYFRNTNNLGVNECHVSTRGYPVLVAKALGYFSQQFEDWPCSGAIVADVWGTGGPANPGVGTIGGVGQWTDAPQITHVDNDDSLVTISIGGNDAGFGTLVKECTAEAGTLMLNTAVTQLNARIVARANARIATFNGIINRLNAANFYNPFWINIPNLPTVPSIPPITTPPSCLANTSAILNVLLNGGPETLCRNGNAVMDPIAGTTGCPAGFTTYNFVAPSLKEVYLEIAKRAAPGAKIQVMAYPPIINPAGITSPCSVNVSGTINASGTLTFTPATFLPAFAVALLPASFTAPITYSYTRTLTPNVNVPGLLPTGVTNMLTAANALNNVIAASVAAAAAVDPDIELVDPYSQFAPPANGGAGGWFCNSPGPSTTNPYFNQIQFTPLAVNVTFTNFVPALTSTALGSQVVDPGTIHPNAVGANALACAFLGTPVASC